MDIDFKDEYATLRQEILERFERIHDTAKYGIGAFVAFLSYCFVHPEFDNFIALLIPQSLTALIGLSSLRLYKSIYVVGTYIAVVIEHDSGAKWHRVGRQFDRYQKEHKRHGWTHGLPFPFGSRWGADSAQSDILLITLIIVGIVSVLYRAGSFSAILPNCSFQWTLFVLSLIILFCNGVVVYQMFWGMKKFTTNCRDTWKKYRSDFGKDFHDEYHDC